MQVFALMAGHSWTDSGLVAETFINKMQLGQYRNVKNSKLSGGNKRKVCTAMSLIGAPQVTHSNLASRIRQSSS